jgi:hypothetical protein
MIIASTITERPFQAELAPLGFSPNRTGGHMARSMMLQELTELCRSVPAEMEPGGYQRVVVEENLLGKPTLSSRREVGGKGNGPPFNRPLPPGLAKTAEPRIGELSSAKKKRDSSFFFPYH